jgi:hypothetical protein
MISIRLKISPDIKTVIEAVSSEIQSGIDRGFLSVLEHAGEEAKTLAPYRTGRLRGSISAYLTGKRQGAVVAKAPYSSFLHEGTGIYGPHKKAIVIVPQEKEALWWKGALHPVKMVVVKGIKPIPFIKRALQNTLIKTAFEKGFKKGD